MQLCKHNLCSDVLFRRKRCFFLTTFLNKSLIFSLFLIVIFNIKHCNWCWHADVWALSCCEFAPVKIANCACFVFQMLLISHCWIMNFKLTEKNNFFPNWWAATFVDVFPTWHCFKTLNSPYQQIPKLCDFTEDICTTERTKLFVR